MSDSYDLICTAATNRWTVNDISVICWNLRYFTYAVNTIAIRLRYDYDPTTTYRVRLLPFDAIRREQKMNMSIFRRSRIVVESQLWGLGFTDVNRI